ncbi:MAG: hypothetical protein EOO50_06335 [Flavobacterium sp.]|uniref:hypothetical protein n=1 Tax=Flavobacterium sp. TaxID=239 RepID=UPI00122495FB|nr:hypothetical protein [Flavobacterium sp.]RZJ67358.1 MAG: hypothetical protein EOO50_06335 [Flavobacterium sp.]
MRHFFVLFVLCPIVGFSQDRGFETRLQSLQNTDAAFHTIDGYIITSQLFENKFDAKGLKKPARKYELNVDELKVSDDSLGHKNYVVKSSKIIADGIVQSDTYYFVENKEKNVLVVGLSTMDDPNPAFERRFTKMLLDNAIPKSTYTTMEPDSINFAGRKFKRSSSCYWTFLNTLQCPYYGEISWSVHEKENTASKAVAAQFAVTKNRKNVKILQDDEVDIIFESVPVKARKRVLDFTGVTGLLTAMSGVKTLTAYYVVAPVRGNYVACVLSYWDKDQINASGLPPLLEEVMQLKQP